MQLLESWAVAQFAKSWLGWEYRHIDYVEATKHLQAAVRAL